MKTPSAVLRKASGLIKMYGEHFDYLGARDRIDAFRFVFPEKTDTGFPFVYLYDKERDAVSEVTGFEALDIISLYLK